MRDILFYSNFDNISATMLVTEMIKDKKEDLNIKLSTGGGAMKAGLPVIANMRNREGKVEVSVEGCAYSLGAAMLLYADRATATSLSEGMIHAVSYPEWFKPTADEKKELKDFNKNMRNAINEKLIDGELKTEILSKYDKGRDKFLTAAEMKEVGLISEIIPIDVSASNYVEKSYARQEYEFQRDVLNTYQITNKTNEEMDLQQFKKDHSEVYNEAMNEERSRVTKLLKYSTAVPDLVNQKIKDGSGMDEAFMEKIIEANAKENGKNAMEKVETPKGEQREAKNKDGKDAESEKKDPTTAQMRVLYQMQEHECTDGEIQEYKNAHNLK